MVHYEDGILTIEVKTALPLDKVTRWKETLSQTLEPFPLQQDGCYPKLDYWVWLFFYGLCGDGTSIELTIKNGGFSVKAPGHFTGIELKDALIKAAFRATKSGNLSEIDFGNLFEMLYVLTPEDEKDRLELLDEPEN